MSCEGFIEAQRRRQEALIALKDFKDRLRELEKKLEVPKVTTICH